MTHQMLVEPGRDGRAAAGRDALRAGGRRHVDHHRTPGRVQSRDPRATRRRGAERVADLRSTSRARVRPELRRSLRVRDGRRDPRRDRARRARVRGHRDAARDRRRDPGRRRAACAKAACSRRPTARPTSASSCPHAIRRARRPVPALDPPRQAVQLHGVERTSTRSPAPGRDALFVVRCRRGRARRRATATRCSCAVAARRDARARARRADPARQRAGVLSRGEPAARRRPCASRSPACPTTTRSSRWSRSDDARRRCSSCFDDAADAVRVAVAAIDRDVSPRPHRRARPVRARPRRRRGRVSRCSNARRCGS